MFGIVNPSNAPLILFAILGMLVVLIQGTAIFLWQVNGVEVIKVFLPQITIIRTTFGYSFKKELDISSIKNIEIMANEHDMGNGWEYLRPATPFFRFNVGRIAIQLRSGKVFRIGSGLTDSEANSAAYGIKQALSNSGFYMDIPESKPHSQQEGVQGSNSNTATNKQERQREANRILIIGAICIVGTIVLFLLINSIR
jgi:hypothetical protein